jgi:dethiobiotin synthetase
MKHAPLFITGTDTGVGKTVLAALVAGFLRQSGLRVAAFKPVCSGSRDDARLLADALGGTQRLDEINPWHFRAPIAPLLAARREHRRVSLAQILAQARRLRQHFDLVVVEGAGGLLSPLAEDADSRDVIAALRAIPVLVGPNQLGVVNHLRLTLAALPPAARARAMVVLMSPETPDAATRTNAALLAEYFDATRIVGLPWLGRRVNLDLALKNVRVRKGLEACLRRQLAKNGGWR